jgi:hypothetical protein
MRFYYKACLNSLPHCVQLLVALFIVHFIKYWQRPVRPQYVYWRWATMVLERHRQLKTFKEEQ